MPTPSLKLKLRCAFEAMGNDVTVAIGAEVLEEGLTRIPGVSRSRGRFGIIIFEMIFEFKN